MCLIMYICAEHTCMYVLDIRTCNVSIRVGLEYRTYVIADIKLCALLEQELTQRYPP